MTYCWYSGRDLVATGDSDRAYSVQVLGTDSQWVETSDQVRPPCDLAADR